MLNIIKRQLIKKWLDKEVNLDKKMNEEIVSFQMNGIKVLKQDFNIEVKGSGKSFTVTMDENIKFELSKEEKRKKGLVELNLSCSKNKINISNAIFEDEETLKQQIKFFDVERSQSLEESLKELQRKNKKRIKDIQEEINEKSIVYISNNYKNFLKLVESLNDKDTLKIVLGESFLSKEKRLKKIKENMIIKSMINLSRDKREQRVFTDIKKTYIQIFKKNGDMIQLDPKNFARFLIQMTLIMKEIRILDKTIRGLKRIKKTLKTELDDLIEFKLEELIDIIRKKEDNLEEIIQKLNPKALVRSIENELNKYYRKEEVYIE